MSHKDRNHVQVPAKLPPWLDGPRIRAEAKRLNVSFAEAGRVLRRRHVTPKKGKK